MPVLVTPPSGRKFDFEVYDILSNKFSDLKMQDDHVLINTNDINRVKKELPSGYNAKKVKLKAAKEILLDEVRHASKELNNDRRKAHNGKRGAANPTKLQKTNQTADLLIAFHKASSQGFNRVADTINNNVNIFGAATISITLLAGTIWIGYKVTTAMQNMVPRRDQNIQEIEDNLGYTPKSRAWTKTDNEENPPSAELAPGNE